MSSDKPQVPKSNKETKIVTLLRGFPKRPEAVTSEELLSSAQKIQKFEETYQRTEFESFKPVVTDLKSLDGLGAMKFKLKEQDPTAQPSKVVAFDSSFKNKPPQGG